MYSYFSNAYYCLKDTNYQMARQNGLRCFSVKSLSTQLLIASRFSISQRQIVIYNYSFIQKKWVWGIPQHIILLQPWQ